MRSNYELSFCFCVVNRKLLHTTFIWPRAHHPSLQMRSPRPRIIRVGCLRIVWSSVYGIVYSPHLYCCILLNTPKPSWLTSSPSICLSKVLITRPNTATQIQSVSTFYTLRYGSAVQIGQCEVNVGYTKGLSPFMSLWCVRHLPDDG